MMKQHKIIGVLGGMGPAATADFMKNIIDTTAASCDQDHVPLIVFSDPTIPDRSTAILDAHAPSPVPMLSEYARRLQDAGATAIVIPCNTAHHFYDQITQSVNIPVLHIVDAVIKDIEKIENAKCRTITLMATEGTVSSRFYERKLKAHGYSCNIPEKQQQDSINQVIRLIKSGNIEQARADIVPIIRSLRDGGSDIVILACTELPLVKDVVEKEMSVIDSTRSLAKFSNNYVKDCQ